MDQYSPTQFAPLDDPSIFSRPNAGDDTLFAVFYLGILKNEPRSIEQGRPIFDDVECVRIMVPGDRNNVVDRPATQQDKHRFAKQYDMFKQGIKEEDQITGTRLTDWPFLSRAQCEELKYLGLRTVEHLAEARDDLCGKVPGLTTLKQNAHIWLSKAKNSAEAAIQAKKMADQQSQIETLQRAIRDQGERIEKLLAEKAKG
jgi:hypothetical protein